MSLIDLNIVKRYATQERLEKIALLKEKSITYIMDKITESIIHLQYNFIIYNKIYLLGNWTLNSGNIQDLYMIYPDEFHRLITELKCDGIIINTEYYLIVKCKAYIKIGCQQHTPEKWASFTDEEIDCMDDKATEFWHKYKSLILLEI